MDEENPKLFHYTTPKAVWKPSDGIWVSETTLRGAYSPGDKLVKWEPLPGRGQLDEPPLTPGQKAELLTFKRRLRHQRLRWRHVQAREKFIETIPVVIAA